MKLRPRGYQIEAMEATREVIRKGARAVIYCGATGSGKTVAAAYFIENSVARKSNVLFLYRGSELGIQCSEKLDNLGIKHGIIQAGNARVNTHPVQVASAETFVRRIRKAGSEFGPWIPKANVIIVDEAHESITPTILEILAYYPDAIIIGLTATPQRTDGKGLGRHCGGFFDAIVLAGTTKQLIDEGFLSQFEIYDSPMKLDFGGVKLKGGEFDDGEVAQIIDKPKVIGSVYTNWKMHAIGKKTLVFAMNRLHGQHLCDEFVDKGEKFVYIDALTPKDERDRIVAEFRKPGVRTITGLVSVGLFLRGFDVLDLECISMARPTMSLILFLQSFGRGLRPWPNKVLIYLDHGNNVARHGFPDDEREWSLDGKKTGTPKERVASQTTCPQCYGIHRSGILKCHYILPFGERRGEVCGYEFAAPGPEIPKTAEEVILTKKERSVIDKAEKQAVVAAEVNDLLDMVGLQRKDSRRWDYALHRFKVKYGYNPNKKHGAKLNWVPGASPSGWILGSWEFNGEVFSANN